MDTFTVVHVLLSVVGIGAGFVVVSGMLGAKHYRGWALVFLASTVATSVTGFFFPFHGFTPGLGVGGLSLVVLALAILALYGRHLEGAWRWIYVVSSELALYLNVFVLIVQLFEKVPVLKTLAPTQGDPPFLVAQSIVLVIFLGLGAMSVIRFRKEPVRAF